MRLNLAQKCRAGGELRTYLASRPISSAKPASPPPASMKAKPWETELRSPPSARGFRGPSPDADLGDSHAAVGPGFVRGVTFTLRDLDRDPSNGDRT